MRAWTTNVQGETFHNAELGPLHACFQHTTGYVHTGISVQPLCGVWFSHMRRKGQWCIGVSLFNWNATIGDNCDGLEFDAYRDSEP